MEDPHFLHMQRDCDFINGRNALTVYDMKITINELLSFTE